MLIKLTALAPLRVRAGREGPRGPAVCERGPCCRGTRSSTAPEQGTGRRASNAHEHRNRPGTLISQSDQIRSFTSERVKICYSVLFLIPASTKALQARVYYPPIAFSILRIDNQRQPSPFSTSLENYYMEIPYSMSECKTFPLKWDDRSINSDFDLCSSPRPFSVVFGPLLIWRRKPP